MFLFYDLRKKYGATSFKPIALAMIIFALNHVDKKVMNPEHGTWIKNKDVLPEWTKESVKRLVSMEKHTEADLVKNWDDGDNEIFTFSTTSEEEF